MTDTPADATTRRTVLRRGLLATGGIALGLPAADRAGAQATRQMVLPAVERFADNYEGQFVFVDRSIEVDTSEVPTDECSLDSPWPPGRTQTYEGRLLDRVSERPLSVDLEVYTPEAQPLIQPGTHFVVQNAVECPGDYVGLEAEWVTREAVSGEDEPPGPTVAEGATPTDTGVPGFGAAVALGGVAVALAVRALGSLRRERS